MEDKIKLVFQFVIPSIIGSSVLTAIINNYFVSVANKKNSSLENITKERDLWRKKLRELVKRISALDYQQKNEIQLCINEIIVSINPFGKSTWSEWNDKSISSWTKNDGYLWEDIEKINKKIKKGDSYSEKEWEEDKDSLVYNVSILLKLDWERSKDEIKGNTLRKAAYISITVIEFLILFFGREVLIAIFQLPINESFIPIIAFLGILISPLLERFIIKMIDSTWQDKLFIVLVTIFYLPLLNAVLIQHLKDASFDMGAVILLIVANGLLMMLTFMEVGLSFGKTSSYFKIKKDSKRKEKSKKKKAKRKKKNKKKLFSKCM